MNKIEKISLNNVLPRVFAGSETDAPVSLSQVWLHNVVFNRDNSYLVEAESGTGKSSMCSFIYGNRHDYSGNILFNDTDVASFQVNDWCEIRRRHLALLPQEMRLFSELTALENIMIKNRLTDHLTESEIRKLLAELEIDHKADQLAARLSIGQQQRVAIVRTLCQPFDFIILDEPVSHLDARNNAIVAGMIKRVADENHAGIITTSVGNPLLLSNAESVKL
jgi:ABC-type lipoprotein export system ATPase subunit